MNFNCELVAYSDVEHLQQIYTGFSLLDRQGFLKLKQTIPPEFLQNKNTFNRWTDYKFFNAKVVINGEITVFYDTHDWNWIDEEILREADFYFKRSYDADYVSQLQEKSKVFPLGLNYQVASSEKDSFKLARAAFHGGRDKIKAIVKGLRADKFLGAKGETEQLKNLESFPNFTVEPKILFMARVWNPILVPDKKQKETIEELNENRAECVRALRKAFGERFFGGLAHEDYAVEHFRDCLLPETNLSRKRKYLKILKDFPICVTTAGLNKSNGWKLGEYVAFSKAIVTEPLFFQIPGDFAKEKNYLEFTASDELINQTGRLFEDKNLRLEMMMNNYRYYQSYVKPDSLILNSLALVFNQQKA